MASGQEQLDYVAEVIASGRAEPSAYQFSYASPTHSWSAPLVAIPCIECGKRTARTLPYCPRCLGMVAHCRLGRTELRDARGERYAFLGLFAHDPSQPAGARVFAPEQLVLPYLGEVRDSVDWLTERYGQHTVPYGFKHGAAQRYTDSALIRGAGASINTATPALRNNLVFRDAEPLAAIVATEPIYNGDELLLDYGPYYKVDEPHVAFETSTRAANAVRSGGAPGFRRPTNRGGTAWVPPLPPLR